MPCVNAAFNSLLNHAIDNFPDWENQAKRKSFMLGKMFIELAENCSKERSMQKQLLQKKLSEKTKKTKNLRISYRKDKCDFLKQKATKFIKSQRNKETVKKIAFQERAPAK